MPISATPPATAPTISSLRRSSKSTVTWGCIARKEAQFLGQKFGHRVGIAEHTNLPSQPIRIGAEPLAQALRLVQHGAGMFPAVSARPA